MPALQNARHERFAQELAKGKTADEAYQQAGYAENRGNAVRLKANENVLRRITELKDRAAFRVEVSLDSIARQLDEDRALAFAVKQPGAAVAASMGKAKLFGLVVDKVKTDATIRDEREHDDDELWHIARAGSAGVIGTA